VAGRQQRCACALVAHVTFEVPCLRQGAKGWQPGNVVQALLPLGKAKPAASDFGPVRALDLAASGAQQQGSFRKSRRAISDLFGRSAWPPVARCSKDRNAGERSDFGPVRLVEWAASGAPQPRHRLAELGRSSPGEELGKWCVATSFCLVFPINCFNTKRPNAFGHSDGFGRNAHDFYLHVQSLFAAAVLFFGKTRGRKRK